MNKIDWNLFRDKFLLSTKNLKYKTGLAYKGGINKFIEWLESNNINRPIPEDIFTFFFYLQKDSPSLFTHNLYMTTLKLFFKYLSQPHIRLYPDIYTIARPKISKPDRGKHYRKTPTDENIKELLQACIGTEQKDKRDGLMIECSAYCGLLASEISTLKTEDLKKEEELYTLWILQKNKHVKRPIFVNKDLGKRLAIYIETYRIKGYIFKDTVHNESARPHLNSATITSIIGNRMEAAGFKCKTITAYSLRHYAGTNYYKKSLDLKATQQFMGHNDRQTTEIYAQDEDNYKKNKIALEPRFVVHMKP